ncbi:MAG: PAS domain S-box protein [Pararhodobacter sp.]|nr:PAS domain S-box protein [Pararhodobacter sp.]
MKTIVPIHLEPAQALARLTEAQALSLQLVESLLAVAPDKLDDAIGQTLAQLGQFCGSDRTYIFMQTRPGFMDNTHEWCGPGIAPMIDMLKDLPMAMADPWWPLFDSQGHVYIADVLDLAPGEPLRETLEMQGIRSLLAVPLREDGRLVGFMGYDSVSEVRSFLQGEIFLIQSVANIISTMLTRRRIEAEVTKARMQEDLERNRLRATLSALPDVVLELDNNLRISAMHANDRVNTPIPPEQLVGVELAQVFPPHVLALARDILRTLERDGIALNHRCHVEIGGRVLWYSISAARRAAQTPDGPPGYVVILRDVTERRAQMAEIERLGQIVRNTTNLVIMTDPHGRIDWVNPAFEARTGFSLAEARGQKPGDLLQCPETDRETVARIGKARASGQPIMAELLNRTKSGERYWVEMNIQPLRDEGGTLTGFMAIQTETTQRHEYTRKLELALTAEETARNRLDAAVEIMQDGFILFDSDQRLVLFNRRFRELFPETVAQMGTGASYTSMLRAGIEAGYLARKDPDPQGWIDRQTNEFALRVRSSGTMRVGNRWLSFSQMPTPDGGRIGVFSDITDFKDAERRALSDRALAMDSAQDGFALVSSHGTLLYANPSALRLLGFGRKEDVIGQHWLDTLRADAPTNDFGLAARRLERDGSWSGQMRLIRLDGQPIDVEVSAARNTDGGILLMLRDISERLRNETERERLREDLALASRRADLSLLAMGLTHDFNNLLAAISAAASLIEEDGTPTTRAMAENIGAAVDQAAGLVRRLMSLGRQSAGKGLIDLRTPMRDAATLVEAGLRPPLRLELSLPDRPVPGLADSTALMQMALNLCINARDALQQSPPADAPGRIRLVMEPMTESDRARRFDIGALVEGTDYVRIEISDNGPGMDAQTLAAAFTPYFTTKGEKGTGLGVPIAVEAVRGHDGAINLESRSGEGTRFAIFLPVAPDGKTD